MISFRSSHSASSAALLDILYVLLRVTASEKGYKGRVYYSSIAGAKGTMKRNVRGDREEVRRRRADVSLERGASDCEVSDRCG